MVVQFNCSDEVNNEYDMFDEVDEEMIENSQQTTPEEQGKVTPQWDDKAITKLIAAVKTHQCLWNTQHKEYNSKPHRDFAWQNIFHLFEEKYAVDDLSFQWANLQIKFTDYTANQKKRKYGQDNKPTVDWPFYKPLKFLEVAKIGQKNNSKTNMVSELIFYCFLTKFRIELPSHRFVLK